MNVTVVHNEDAGHGDEGRRDLKRWILRAGHSPSFCVVEDVEQLAARLRDPGDLVVVAGGDGSVRAVGKALAGRQVPLTILPMGTANNVASHLGLCGDIDALIEQWPTFEPRPFDVGTVSAPWGRDVFFEACGFGALARTMAALSPVEAPPSDDGTPDDELMRDLEVAREMLADHPLHEVEVEADGEHLTGTYAVVEALNIRSIGANVTLSRDAREGDGLLDLVLVDADGRRLLRDYLTARLDALAEGDRSRQPVLDLPVRRARAITLRWSGSRVHVDDEIVPDEEHASSGRHWVDGQCTLEIGVMPGALTMLAPR